MIKEIVEFMDANDGIEEYFIADEPPKTYEHFYIKIDIQADGYQINNEKSTFWEYASLGDKEKEFIKYMTYYQKALFNKALDRIHGLKGSSPYILTLNIVYDGQSFKSDINDSKEPRGKKRYFFNRIKKHFDDAKNYISQNEHLEKLKTSLLDGLEDIIFNNQDFAGSMKAKFDKKNEGDIQISLRVYIDFENFSTKYAREFNSNYLIDSVFLSSDIKYVQHGECSICGNIGELSLPAFLNTMGDDFGMKPTMSIVLTNFVCKNCSVKLYKFKIMTDNHQLTKPFPLFIDKKSLFGEQKSILNDNEKKKKYREIVKAIYNTNPKDLKNFYLLNYYSVFNNGNKTYDLQIKDIDYVENFEYMTLFEIYNFMDLQYSFKLADFYGQELSVFQFEKIANELIFEEKLQNNYFSNYKDFEITYSRLKPPKNKNSNSLLKNYLIKYRQNFYDFIYKSYKTRLWEIEFREMILDIIKDNIKHDDSNKNGYSIYENEIREKLNLLFSIGHHFKNGGEKMEKGKFVKLKEQMNSSLGYWQDKKNEKGEPVLKDNGKVEKEFIGGADHIDSNDEFFAFLCGQMARFLISKKKSKEENKSHSDFNAFVDWQTSKLLKEYIFEVHKKYAHALKFRKRYENAMSIIQTYRDDLDMESVAEYMIAGYFADNQILNQTQEEDDE